MRALAVGMIALCSAVGCAQTPGAAEAEKPELTPELKALVLEQTPSDLQHPLFLDFNGKVALIGYALEAGSLATPGSKLSLKLYWRASGKLEPGYAIFTELTTPDGRRFDVTGTGALRSGLPTANWEVGNVYVDNLDITVPTDIDAARFSIVVGLKTDPIAPPEPAEAEKDAKDAKDAKKDDKNVEAKFDSVYLSVLSGTADAKHGGVVATLETGVTTASLRARAAKEKDDKTRQGGAKRPKLPLAKPAP